MKFSQTHEWVQVEGEIATVGISDYAQKELGEVVYVELPKVGHSLTTGDEAAVLESTKAAVDIYAPLSGVITAVNEELRTHPELINSSAESTGWLYKLKLKDANELGFLMTQSIYEAYISQASL